MTDAAPNVPAPTAPVADTNNTRTQNKSVIKLNQHSPYLSTRNMLPRGPNFAIVSKYPPKKSTSQPLKRLVLNSLNREVEEFRSDPSRILKNLGTHIKPNLTVEEHQALTQLMVDTSRVVLTTDKGVAMVIMDKPDYTDKALALLEDTNTFSTRTQTTKIKNKVITGGPA